MLAILSWLPILFINYISCDLNNTKILLYKFFIRYLVVKPACVNAVLIKSYHEEGGFAVFDLSKPK